jgi:hypothetical protein
MRELAVMGGVIGIAAFTQERQSGDSTNRRYKWHMFALSLMDEFSPLWCHNAQGPSILWTQANHLAIRVL